MRGIRISLVVFPAFIILASCRSELAAIRINEQVIVNETITDNEPVLFNEPVTVIESVVIEENFDPASISLTTYNSTKEEVQFFIEDLNKIIKNKNYDAWKMVLSSEYFKEISSEENLKRMSEQPAMKTRKIVLKTPEEYFENVVVPSRDNLRVDDIEFIGRYKVKAFTVTTNKAGDEQKIRLYDLEKINNSWTIIN
jgi:hypothetical protein